MKFCIVEGCEKNQHVRLGYCNNHYYKFKTYGDPLGGRKNKYSAGETPATCTIEGCESKHGHSGLCQAHYLRKKKLGSVDALYPSEIEQREKRCAVDECDRKHYCKGFCLRHYQNWFKYGDPLYTVKNTPMAWIERHKGHTGEECLAWPHARLTNGYGTIQVESGKKRIASRVMCEAAHGMPKEESMQAAHNCGNGHLGCVNPSHLRWDTVAGNGRDKIKHGTFLFGGKAPWSKLTEKQARYIKYEGAKVNAPILAEEFNVSVWAVYSIRQGKTWAHLNGQRDYRSMGF